MYSPSRSGGRLPVRTLALAMAVWASLGSSTIAQGVGYPAVTPNGRKVMAVRHHERPAAGFGTLGYGPPGLIPGFQGFGLGYHLGNGYGGYALGVGVDGGYPYYGGPGYPHGEPVLRRFKPITPFPYYGGPGYPAPGHPQYFGEVGPLTSDQPVVTVEGSTAADYATGYGNFTGMMPYPEAFFAPFTVKEPSASSSPATVPAADLGIDVEESVDPDAVRGLKVTKVHPESPADKAGLKTGDVINSINGYLTAQRGNLPWIIDNAAPTKILSLTVRTASDGKAHTITARLH